MDIKKLQATVINALEDIKAQDIALYDTTKLTSLFDCMAIASGSSNRQTKALAASVRDKVKAAGGTVVGMEGADSGEWVLVDLGDMIVHIMQPAIRAYYRLEEIWGGKPIALATAKGPKSKPAARKTPAKKTSKTGKAVPKKEAAAKKSAVAGKTNTTRKQATVEGNAQAPAKPRAAAKRTVAKKTAK